MPTSRFYSFLFAAFVFYFLANQTQIGWLFVVSALLGGILLAGFFLNRRSLKNIAGSRQLSIPEDEALHEGADLTITLQVDNQRTVAAAHLHILEHCPLAAPDSDEHHLPMFIPTLSENVQFDYAFTVHRRGVFHFPPLKMTSRAPFGFSKKKGQIDVPTSVLVYPEVKKMRRFALLDRQPAAQLSNPRAGIGNEVIGVREYRRGDSQRHIHWRSVARRGQLISKEFAEEIQPGITIVLDRYAPISTETKHNPFEIAIKCAVTMAEYAMRNHYPVHLAVDNEDMAFPQGALVWDALMQYTARVESRQTQNLSDVMSYQPMQQFVAIALSWADEALLETLFVMKHRGYNLFVAIPDPSSFPLDTDVSAQSMKSALEQAGIDAVLISHGDNWAEKLSDR
ncbi:MAG: DUF58 domain-containing protein [Anaerolineae bacterium]|nr:DUF58 domain-containing protein [Anaerolineae bacterium]